MRTPFALITFIIISSLSMGIMGCGEDLADDTAIMIGTDPDDGGRIFTEEDLTITFDRTVASVKVNGISADVYDTEAAWNGAQLEAGKQDLIIEWTDENGNTDYGEITLTVHELDLATCSGAEDCSGPYCEFQ